MTATINSANLGGGVIFTVTFAGLSISEADFFLSLAKTLKADQLEVPQHSSHEVILDAAMKLCDRFGKDDPEYPASAVRIAALAVRIATEGEDAFDRAA